MVWRLRWVEAWYAPFALVNGAALGLTPILLPLAVEGRGAGQVGLVMGAYNIGALAAPPAGALADRWRLHRLLAVVCAGVSAVSLWLFPRVGSAAQLGLGFLDGASFAAMITVANLLIVERQPQSEWNTRLGWLETVLSLGQGGALLLAGHLSAMTARSGLAFAAIVPATAMPLAALLVPRPGPPAAPVEDHRLAHAGHAGEWGSGSPSRHHHRLSTDIFSRPLRIFRGGFGLLLVAWIPAYAGAALVFSLYPVLFKHAFHIGPGTSSLAFALIVFASLPLYSLAGRMGQRTGPRPALLTGLGIRLIVLAALAILAALHGVPAAAPLVAFSGVVFGWAFLSVASPGLTAQLVPRDAEGQAQGALNAASGIAGLAGSIIGGAIAAHLGYSAALGVAAGAVAFGLSFFTLAVSRSAGGANRNAHTSRRPTQRPAHVTKQQPQPGGS